LASEKVIIGLVGRPNIFTAENFGKDKYGLKGLFDGKYLVGKGSAEGLKNDSFKKGLARGAVEPPKRAGRRRFPVGKILSAGGFGLVTKSAGKAGHFAGRKG